MTPKVFIRHVVQLEVAWRAEAINQLYVFVRDVFRVVRKGQDRTSGGGCEDVRLMC